MRIPTASSAKDDAILWAFFLPAVLWFAALLACNIPTGAKLDGILDGLMQSMNAPLAVRWTERTPAFLGGAALAYAFGIAMYYGTRKNSRPGEEHGSARWGSAAALGKKYADRKHPDNNVILTQYVRMGMDVRRHQRNLHTLCIGGSGAGKTRFLCKPLLMDANCSYLVLDPKGEMLRATGHLLEREGYQIQVFDLVDMARSDCFNPFMYLRNDEDVLKLINNLIKNTTPKNAQQNDPFWEKAETALLSALCLYLYHEAPPSEQNFSTIQYMLEHAGASEEDEDFRSPLDLLFTALEEEFPRHIAVKQYHIFKQSAGKTAKSIILQTAVRLYAFNLESIQRITDRDTLDLGSLGERKRAIFCIVPDNDTSLNYLVGMLYTSAFQALYQKADREHGGSLPVHVRCIFDEFLNVPQPENFLQVLQTARSRNLSFVVVIQAIAGLKARYKDDWEAIVGNCDSILYLGGNEQGTHKYLSEMLGKATIDTKTSGLTRGRSGSSSENFQRAGRELLTPDEVRQLDNRYGLLFIRGELPVVDLKYDLLHHPNIKFTEDGGAEPYVRAAASYEQPDLSMPFTGLDDIKIYD